MPISFVAGSDSQRGSSAGGAPGVASAATLHEQITQLQKTEIVGRLAGGVAHDFNNLLTIIIGCSEVLLTKPDLDRETRELLEDIRKAGDRASHLTRQLLAFSRRKAVQPTTLSLNQVVSNLSTMLRRLIGEDIDLSVQLDPNLGPVRADPGQVEQVIMNLVVNARDAMPEGGKLAIETARREITPAQAGKCPDLPAGVYATIAIRDSGCGMDAATMAHIFEPFFTTKAPGKGTGLGLATAYGIVKECGGHIQVTSEPRVGTRFRIYLPQVRETAASPAAPARALPVARGKETILLVEDESCVRVVARQILRKNGYTVLEAGDGAEALALAAAHNGPIDLLVTDVVMPFLSGPQLASLLTQQRPETRVLYMSGYTDSAIARHGKQPLSTTLIMKPFTPNSLAALVRKILDA